MLIPKAAQSIPRQGKRLRWTPGLDKPTPVDDWPGLREIFEAGKPEVLRIKDKRYEKNLKKLPTASGLRRR